ncbi:hypothetical protein TSUD_127500 [Trifolium subterraneum]|nr:hypothetical protein TSUD_127500 [Trifolium subterraneum]
MKTEGADGSVRGSCWAMVMALEGAMEGAKRWKQQWSVSRNSDSGERCHEQWPEDV